MDFFTMVKNNLLSAPILFFLLGTLTCFLKEPLSLPKSVGKFLSMYLIISIGLKGGFAFLTSSPLSATVIWVFVIAIALSFFQPFLGYYILRKTSKLDPVNISALVSHYGSISMVTFLTAASFLRIKEIPFDGYIISVLAIMEAPAIISGLWLAKKYGQKTGVKKFSMTDAFFNESVFLLLGAFLVGSLIDKPEMEKLSPFFITPFHGLLCLFLFDMGTKVAAEIEGLKKLSPTILAFGIYMPLMMAAFSLFLCYVLGLRLGTSLLFMVLSASASYIAVPAAMRYALPGAQASIYLPMTLAVTFPFNIFLGIPLYYYLAHRIMG